MQTSQGSTRVGGGSRAGFCDQFVSGGRRSPTDPSNLAASEAQPRRGLLTWQPPTATGVILKRIWGWDWKGTRPTALRRGSRAPN